MAEDLNRLTLCMIVKNDEKESVTLKDAISSVYRYVDFINITVTKFNKDDAVKDALLETFELFEDKISISEFEWCDDFAKARNFNLEQSTTDLVFWIDSDDIVIGAENMGEALYQFRKYPALNALWMDYRYAFDEDGNCINIFPRERIFKKSLYSWKGRLHENAICLYQPVKKDIKNIFIKHNLDSSVLNEKALRNLKVIESAYKNEIKKDTPDPRTFYDYARSLVAVADYEKAKDIYDLFLKNTESENDAYEALIRLCEIYLIGDDVLQARLTALKAINLKYQYPDAYLSLAKCAFLQKQWKETLHWIKKAKNLKPYTCGLPLDPLTYNIQPMKMAADCLFFLNRAEESLKVIREAKKYVPSDKALKDAEERTMKYLNRITLEKGVLALLDWLKNNDEKDKIKNLLNALPTEVSDMPAVIREKNKLEQKTISNRLVIYCHETHEDWGVDKEASGIGGSEEAVINISRNLAKLGWNVEVYCSCSAPGFYDGVMWKQFYQHDPKMPCDVFIAWRHSEYVLFAPKDSYKILWLHDRQTITNYTPQVISTIDKIFVLSDYHRKDLPEISDDKFYITRNGINTEDFEISEEKIIAAEHNKAYVNNIIYASSPDRGLDILLDNWEKIKDINPKAVLHVFYGFTPTYDQVYANNPEKIAFKQRILNQLKTLPDVFYHGRVGHKDLAKWFLKCGFWFYPTYFTEISCITAMKAQAAGCIPVATDTAALAETISTDISPLVSGDILKKETQGKWLDLYKKYIAENNLEHRIKMRNWAIDKFGYKKLALDWSEKFKFWQKKKSVKQKTKKAVLV